MQLTTALARGPNGAKILLLFMAPRQVGKGAGTGVFDSAPRIRVGGKNKKSWVLNLGGLDIKICSLAWVEEAQHGG
jgi:hypothetical protein